MRFLVVGALALVSFLLTQGCKPRQTTNASHAKAQVVQVPEGSGNGLNITGTGFVWEKTELPLCYSARNGVKFFVWKEQSTFACNKGQKEWQLFSKQQQTSKKKG
jgi:hypothetical protein